MSAICTPSQTDIDTELEQRIQALYLVGIRAEDPETAREAFYAMGMLIDQRSPQQIASMEAKLPKPWGAR